MLLDKYWIFIVSRPSLEVRATIISYRSKMLFQCIFNYGGSFVEKTACPCVWWYTVSLLSFDAWSDNVIQCSCGVCLKSRWWTNTELALWRGRAYDREVTCSRSDRQGLNFRMCLVCTNVAKAPFIPSCIPTLATPLPGVFKDKKWYS